MSEDKRPEEVIAQAPTSSKTKTDNKELASFEHEQIIQKANIGIFGKLLGGGSEKAGNISGIIVTLLIIYVSVVTYFYLIHDKTAAGNAIQYNYPYSWILVWKFSKEII